MSTAELTPEQQEAFSTMLQRVESLPADQKEALNYFAAKFTMEATLLRFLRAREYDLEQSYNMLVECLKWRTSFQGNGVQNLNTDSFMNELNTGKAFYHGKDKEGRPICYILVRLHDHKESEQEEVQRLVVHLMEKGAQLLTPPLMRCSCVFDLSDLHMKNLDLKAAKFIMEMLEKYYPESLGVALIVNAPWIFHGFWSACSVWLPKNTSEKIKFVSSDEMKNFIDPDQLLVAYGGNDPYEFDTKDML